VAINREVMVAVANSQAPGLQGFLDSIAAIGIPNFMARAHACDTRNDTLDNLGVHALDCASTLSFDVSAC
jgi:hypothetical protein